MIISCYTGGFAWHLSVMCVFILQLRKYRSLAIQSIFAFAYNDDSDVPAYAQPPQSLH